MNIKFKKDGYVARILTWGMPQWKKTSYVNLLQEGCPMFWRFIFMFLWSLGGLRNDGVEDAMTVPNQPKKRSETMTRINERVSEFSETKAAQHIGKGIGTFFGAVFFLAFLVGVAALIFGIGKGIYLFFASGWATILSTAAFIGVTAVLGIAVILLWKSFVWVVRWIGSTEVWALLIQKANSLKDKTCPVVSFA